MRYVPSDRHASILVSALRESALSKSITGEISGPVHANVGAHLEANEGKEEQEFTNVDSEIASYFLKWGKALDAGDDEEAKKWEAKIDALAEDHPFSYKETKKLFYDYQSKSSYAAALENYRAWDGADPEFGVVKAAVPGSGKVAVFGDWGTGTDDARLLFEALMTHQPDVILHLGDIYEAGTPYECQEFFLRPIEEVCEANGWKRPPILTIPGNHEYFTAGVGYFELIDVLNSGLGDEWRQEASFFCLRSDDGKWQFLGGGLRDQGHRGGKPAGLGTKRTRVAPGQAEIVRGSQRDDVSPSVRVRRSGDQRYCNRY